ncbi:MAG: hypothetical protein HRU15_13260 [Planctomycetes bacterium]|nr:hypothetical protein [Planctomycetota bacterium]
MFYCLECKSEEVSCDFWLNDLPVSRRGLDEAERFDGQINEFLIEGMNELSIEIHPAKSEPGLTAARWFDIAPSDAIIHASIMQYPYGAMIGGPDGIERMSLNWHIKDFNNGTMWPMCKTVHFDIGPGFGTMAWQEAEILDMNDPETIDGAMGLLKELHTSLECGQHNTWVDLHGQRLDESDRAYDSAEGAGRGRALRELEHEASHGRKMDLLSENTDSWRLCGEGRLIECCAADGRSNIREMAKKDGSVDHYPVFAGKFGGKWMALR